MEAASDIGDVIASLEHDRRWRVLHDLLVIARGAGWRLDRYVPGRRRTRLSTPHRLVGLECARAFLVLELDLRGGFHGVQTLVADGKRFHMSGDGCDALGDVLRMFGPRDLIARHPLQAG